MIKKIVHLADIHIRKSPSRHPEYSQVFDTAVKNITKDSPDRIVLVGDLFHDYIDIQPEAAILAGNFLTDLSVIAPVIITRGNHDIRKKALKRKDAIEAIVSNLNNPRITYLNETGFHKDENVTWAVWKHGEDNNCPWKKNYKKEDGQTYIDLFHDPINGSVNELGYEFKNKRYVGEKSFKGEFGFFGDIHKFQFITKTSAYPGSLIAQNFGEGDDAKHGYLLWDITNGNYQYKEIENEYSFKTVRVNTFTDFEDLDIEIDDPTPHMRIRVIWNTLPAMKNRINEDRVTKYIKDKYSPIAIYHKSEFIEEDEIDVDEELTVENISNPDTQQEILKNYLEKVGVEDDMVEAIIKLDNEIIEKINQEDFTNILWNIIWFKGANFMSYKELSVDWRGMDGLYQITGLNTAGKTTIMELITYILYNKTPKTETRVKHGDTRYVNNKLDVDTCSGQMVIEVNGEYYGIKRTTTIERKRDGEIKGAPTQLFYYKLSSPDDEFTEENSLSNLIEDDRNKTQKEIEKAIGTYDNFMRVVMTTSDTLNRVLSDDRSVFIDSLLFDSGLDIFDAKLNEFKEHKKDVLSNPRINCNVEKSEEKIIELTEHIEAIISNIDVLENEGIEYEKSKNKGHDYLNQLHSKLNVLSEDIENFDIDDANKQKEVYNEQKELYLERAKTLNKGISELKESYDEEKLNELITSKDNIRQEEFDTKHLITQYEREIDNHKGIINNLKSENIRNKNTGTEYKEQIIELKKSKNCPTCGQPIIGEHKEHINTKIKEITDKMLGVANDMKQVEKKIEEENKKIEELNSKIEEKQKDVDGLVVKHEKLLDDIGELTNDKNDVEKRKELVNELNNIPLKIENIDLNIKNIDNSIAKYNESLSLIERNSKIYIQINKAEEKIKVLQEKHNQVIEKLNELKQEKRQAESDIDLIKKTIKEYKEQVWYDEVMSIYQKSIHRDGIPTQLLKTYAVPKINQALNTILESSQFRIWLDDNDLKLKLAYNSEEKEVIDAISGSGKERTFASVALKFALNEVNIKSKPTLLLLDEIMGKLTDESVDEFISMLTLISAKMKKVLIIEHNHSINYDYLFEVVKDDKGISTLTIK